MLVLCFWWTLFFLSCSFGGFTQVYVFTQQILCLCKTCSIYKQVCIDTGVYIEPTCSIQVIMLLTFPHNTLCQYVSITGWSKKKKNYTKEYLHKNNTFHFNYLITFQHPTKYHGRLRFLTLTLLFIEAKHNNNITKMKNNHDKISTTLYNLSLSLTLLSFSLPST